MLRAHSARTARQALSMVVLPEGETILDSADSCEEAAMEILAPSSERWESAELWAWLRGPYANATRHTKADVSVLEIAHSHSDAAEVREMILATRALVISRLEAARRTGLGAAFTLAFEHGLVVRACDTTGQGGFLPASHARMTLADRVIALLAAEYLTRPPTRESQADPLSGMRVACAVADSRVDDSREDHTPMPPVQPMRTSVWMAVLFAQSPQSPQSR